MKRGIGFLFAVLMIIICFAANLHAANNVVVKNNDISHRDGALTVKGNLPKIEGMSNAIFMGKLNQDITKLYDVCVSNAKTNRLKSISFNYEAVHSANITSVILYRTEVSTTATRSFASTFVFNKTTNKYIKITDVLGANGIKICNKAISDAIKGDEKYYDFKGIDDSQQFYVNDGNVVVIFDAGTIANLSKGRQQFEVLYSDIKNMAVGNGEYYYRTAYGIKIVALRRVAEAFGYKVSYNASARTVDITKNDFTASVAIGKNSYKKGKMSNIRLELPPETIDGVTYVPISFFEEIMGIYFAVDKNGHITFSSYTPK